MPPIGEHLFGCYVRGGLSATVVVTAAVHHDESGDDNPNPFTVKYVAKARSHIEYPFVFLKLKERLPFLISYYVDRERKVPKNVSAELNAQGRENRWPRLRWSLVSWPRHRNGCI